MMRRLAERVLTTAEETLISPVRKAIGKWRQGADPALLDKLAACEESGTHAKILQTKLSLCTLLRHKVTDRYVFLTGEVPATLQCVDRTTAENTRACQHDAMKVSRLHPGKFSVVFVMAG